MIKCGMKLLIYSQTSTGQPCTVEVWEWISDFITRFFLRMQLLIHAGLKLNNISKRGPWKITSMVCGAILALQT